MYIAEQSFNYNCTFGKCQILHIKLCELVRLTFSMTPRKRENKTISTAKKWQKF